MGRGGRSQEVGWSWGEKPGRWVGVGVKSHEGGWGVALRSYEIGWGVEVEARKLDWARG